MIACPDEQHELDGTPYHELLAHHLQRMREKFMPTYTDCSGNERELDAMHYHELIDRIHCIREMFDSLVTNHPAYNAVLWNLGQKVQSALGDCYQLAGHAEHNLKESKE